MTSILPMTKVRAMLYSEAFPGRPPLAFDEHWLTGTWCIGAAYKNPNPLYGAHPRGYLERVHCMFPEKRRVLHVFSGGMTAEHAAACAWPKVLQRKLAGDSSAGRELQMELVDLKGPEEGRHPTWQGDATAMPEEWAGRFDLILADPPYSAEDAKRYGVKMPTVSRVMRELHRVAAPGCDLVWLDQRWPMHSKTQWKCWGHVGLVRSTNHRMRLVSFFGVVK